MRVEAINCCEQNRLDRKTNRASPCGKPTRRANHPNPVHPLTQKFSASFVGQISELNPRVSPDQRGRAHVTNVAAGCGGRGVCGRRACAPRTVKSCGPGAPMLAFKSATVLAHRGLRRWQEKP